MGRFRSKSMMRAFRFRMRRLSVELLSVWKSAQYPGVNTVGSAFGGVE